MLLNKTVLLAKLKHGDMIVLDAKYVSLKCLMNLYNTDAGYRVVQDNDCEAQLNGIALTKFVAHMEDLRKEDFTSIQINTSQSCIRIGLSCLVLLLKVRFTLQGSKTCFYLYFQI